MPPVAAAAGAIITAIGGSAAVAAGVSSIVTAAYTAAAWGAVIGAGMSAIRGDDILEGALNGAKTGAIAGGVAGTLGVVAKGLSAAGAATKTGTAIGEGASTATTTGANLGQTVGETADLTSALSNAGSAGAETAKQGLLSKAWEGTKNVFSGENMRQANQAFGDAVGSTSGGGGLLSGVGSFIEKNPNQAAILSQAVGGAAQGLLGSKENEQYYDYMKNRDRLGQIRGLSDINLQQATPQYQPSTTMWEIDENGKLRRKSS